MEGAQEAVGSALRGVGGWVRGVEAGEVKEWVVMVGRRATQAGR